MNNVSDLLDRFKSFFSKKNLTDEEKEERSIEREKYRIEYMIQIIFTLFLKNYEKVKNYQIMKKRI